MKSKEQDKKEAEYQSIHDAINAKITLGNNSQEIINRLKGELLVDNKIPCPDFF
jgi:hypothetical protein